MAEKFVTVVGVILKKEYDPLGESLLKKAQDIGLTKIKNIGTGKVFKITQEAEDIYQAGKNSSEMTSELLANPVLEETSEISTFKK